MRRATAAGALATVVLIVLGLALAFSGDGQEGISREDYTRARLRFDQRVDRALAELERATVLRSLRGLPSDGGVRSRDELRALLRSLSHVLRAEADELAQVEAPGDVRRAHRLLIDSAGGVAKLAGRLSSRPALTGLEVENAFFRSHDAGALGALGRAGDELDAKGYLPDATAGVRPPRPAEVRGCRMRAEGRPLTPDRDRDTIIGPIAFTGLPAIHRDYASRPETWRGVTGVRSIALVRAGARVTLAVPGEQRRWMRLLFWPGFRRRVEPLTLQACRTLESRRAQRPRLPYTQFSGGVGLDFANAPRRGLCAELIVWVEGNDRPLRRWLFRPSPGDCDTRSQHRGSASADPYRSS